jgi:ascorbate-specific PTS system EIIC-type component UlaA
MFEWAYQMQAIFAALVGVFAIGLGLLKRPPSWWSVGAIATVEGLLLVQLAVSIAVVASGEQAVGDTVEFFGYLITALIVPPAAVAWAVLDRTKWSTIVLGLAGLTIAVMLVRMWQIWTGIRFNF